MPKKIRTIFLFIALVQGIHSIEEYFGKLWDVFPPATFLCGFVSSDLEMGFLIINVGLFVVLMLIWLWTFNKHFPRAVLWFWIIMEVINGIGHTVWSIIEAHYTPGIVTAPVLVILALWLSRLLIRERRQS